MKDFNTYYERQRLQCIQIVASMDRREAVAHAERLRYCADMGTDFDSLAKRERSLYFTFEKVGQLSKAIAETKRQLAALESQGAVAV
jgi:hypothetical protein